MILSIILVCVFGALTIASAYFFYGIGTQFFFAIGSVIFIFWLIITDYIKKKQQKRDEEQKKSTHIESSLKDKDTPNDIKNVAHRSTKNL